MARREVIHTAATVMALPALSSLTKLVTTTLASILQVAVMCLAGFYLAKRGVLDKKTQTYVVNSHAETQQIECVDPDTCVTILQGGILFDSRASDGISGCAIWLRNSIGGVGPFGVYHVMGNADPQRPAPVRSITPNSNTLPVALIQSLVGTVPELHWVRDGKDNDTPDDMLGRALTYLVLFSTLGTVQRWSIASNLLSRVSNETPPPPRLERSRTGLTDDVTDYLIDDRHRDQLANRSQVTVDAYRDDPNGQQMDLAPETESFMRKVSRGIRKVIRTVLDFMTIPLWAAVASFVVAMIPSLQQFILSLTPLVGALQQAGGCSIPLTILVLGAYFAGDATDPSRYESENIESQSSSTPDYSWKTITAASTARMILTPLILIPMLAYLCIVSKSKVVDDPIFIACACLVIGSPPALTLAQITSQRGNPNSNIEYLISGTIFVSYTILTAPTTVALVMTALAIDEVQERYILQRGLSLITAQVT